MPKVQQAQRRVRGQISTGQQFNVKTSEETFGGGQAVARMGQALGRVGQATANLLDKLDTEAAQAEFNEYYKKANDLKNKSFHDPNDGFKANKGRQAAENMSSYSSSFQDGLGLIGKDITNPKTRKMFEDLKTKLSVEFDGMMQRHTFDQAQEYDNEQSKARIESLTEDAILNYAEPNIVIGEDGKRRTQGKIDGNIQDIDKAIEEFGQRNGKPREAIDNMKLEAKSKLHYGVISSMLTKKEAKKAKMYFESIKDAKGQLDPETKKKLEGIVNQGNIKSESQTQTDNLMSQGLSQKDALIKARKIKDPEVRDETVRRLKNRYKENELLEESQRERNFNSALKILEQTKSLDTIPEEQLMGMSGKELSALNKRHVQLLKGGIATDREAYNELMTLATDPSTREAFLRKNIAVEYATKFNDADYKKFIDLQGKLRQDDPEGNGIVDGFRSDRQVVTDSLNAALSLNLKTNKKHREIANDFYYQVDKKVEDWKRENKKKNIPNSNLQEIVDELLMPGVVEGSGFFGFFEKETRRFQLERGQVLQIDDVQDIPKRDYSQIEDSIRRRKQNKGDNSPTTEDDILRIYNLSLQRGING